MIKTKRKSLLLQLSQLRKQSDQNTIKCEQKSSIMKWLQQQFNRINYNLSDDYADFLINNLMKQVDHTKVIIIQMFIKPKKGVFQNIQFRPKIFISSIDLVKRPKIFNDRRIYHPNINSYNLQIIYPQLILDWNPTKSLEFYLQKLKYLIIEPNLKFVPNNQINKKAGIQYLFKRKNFKQLVLENQPMILDERIQKRDNQNFIKNQQQNQKIIQQQVKFNYLKQNVQWIDISSIFPSQIIKDSQRFTNKNNYQKSTGIIDLSQNQQISILEKKIKKINVKSGNEIFHQKISDLTLNQEIDLQ